MKTAHVTLKTLCYASLSITGETVTVLYGTYSRSRSFSARKVWQGKKREHNFVSNIKI